MTGECGMYLDESMDTLNKHGRKCITIWYHMIAEKIGKCVLKCILEKQKAQIPKYLRFV